MARSRRGLKLDGWLVVDKPQGMTSARVVAVARALTGAAKAGHAGTLDPLATGVLPIAFGEATKTIPYVMNGDKTYRFTIRWGEARDTDDAEGRVTAESAHRPDAAALVAALAHFTGEIAQVPPRYSAIKVDGQRAYALARANREVTLAARTVRVDRLVMVAMPDADHAMFEMQCGKGTYVRAIARDLALELGTVAHIAAIRRVAVGPFHERHAISLDKPDDVGHIAPPRLLPVETALDDIPALALTETQAGFLRNGRPVRVYGPGGRAFVACDALEEGQIVCAMMAGQAVALARFVGDEIRPVRVLNL